ncbi:TPA: inositol oxygenase-like [Bos taurus]|nr:TPA: inositol oxygenase-like [Bos taurus]
MPLCVYATFCLSIDPSVDTVSFSHFGGCDLRPGSPQAFYIIRFHSFYPWHKFGDYQQLCNEQDLAMLPWVQEFNKFDLYTKSSSLPDVAALRPYYQGLVDKYCPGILCW